MKDLKSVMDKLQSNTQQTIEANQQQEVVKKQVSDNAKSVIDKLFEELKSCYPAWKQAFGDKATWLAAKKTWTKAFIENDVSNMEQVSIGLKEARKSDNPFWPSVGQFIKWCNNSEIDTDEAFNRMIARKPCNGIAEFETRKEVGWRCKTQLPESKARKLFSETLNKNIAKVRSGELVEREMIKAKIESPEAHRAKETPEQRNDRLDREIDQLLAEGKTLLGSHKNRYNERGK